MTPERRAEIKGDLIRAIERADPSRAGRSDVAAEGLILVAELIPRVAEAIARGRDDEGKNFPPIDVALKMVLDYRAGRMDDGPGHDERTEQLLGIALDDLGWSGRPPGERPGPTTFPPGESEAMRLINEAIKRSRGGTPGPPKPKPKGKALRRSRAEIKARSDVTFSDVEAARLDWQRNTRKGYGGLIDATREDEGR